MREKFYQLVLPGFAEKTFMLEEGISRIIITIIIPRNITANLIFRISQKIPYGHPGYMIIRQSIRMEMDIGGNIESVVRNMILK